MPQKATVRWLPVQSLGQGPRKKIKRKRKGPEQSTTGNINSWPPRPTTTHMISSGPRHIHALSASCWHRSIAGLPRLILATLLPVAGPPCCHCPSRLPTRTQASQASRAPGQPESQTCAHEGVVVSAAVNCPQHDSPLARSDSRCLCCFVFRQSMRADTPPFRAADEPGGETGPSFTHSRERGFRAMR